MNEEVEVEPVLKETTVEDPKSRIFERREGKALSWRDVTMKVVSTRIFLRSNGSLFSHRDQNMQKSAANS